MSTPTPEPLPHALPATPPDKPGEPTTPHHAAGDGGTVAQQMPSPAALENAAPAVHVPGYEILGELGRGGMGVVYKARHLRLKRLVALKMIKGGAQVSADERARFHAEAQAVARLQHPNIVQIYEIGDRDGQPFVALEFVEGGTLRQKLNGAPLPPRQAALLLEPLAQAAQAAHERQIVHRDLKPANVLLTAGKVQPKIADFGLAKHLDDDSGRTRTGQIMGTPSYMAPEQAEGRVGDIGPRTDVYALGAILYEMLTGRPPFHGSGVMETLELVRKQEPVPPRRLQPKTPRDLDTICLKCLRKAPHDRYATAGDLADDVRRFLNGEAIRARPLGPLERAARWCRRRPVVAGLGALAGAAVVAFTVYWQTRPAYLNVHVAPAAARVELDGEPLALNDEGRVVAASGPGRHRLLVRADGYRDREQDVVLVRGAENTVVADVALDSAFGFVQIDSQPAGAAVAVRDSARKVVAEGVTPFHSSRLAAGDYVIRLTKDFYSPVEVPATVPEGERTGECPTPTLRPIEHATESMDLLGLMHATAGKWKGDLVIDDPKTTLAEFLDYAAFKHDLVIDTNASAFQNEDVNDVLHYGIAEKQPLRLGLNGEPTTLRKALEAAFASVPAISGVALLPRMTPQGKYVLHVTTKAFAEQEAITVLHPVGDLMEGPGALSEEQLLTAIRNQFPRSPDPEDQIPGRGPLENPSVQYLPAGRVAAVRHNWPTQEAIDAFLTALRQARRVGGKGPDK